MLQFDRGTFMEKQKNYEKVLPLLFLALRDAVQTKIKEGW
jgi:hypothetical protein